MFNVHFPITFDDGVKWLIRIPRPRHSRAPTALLALVSACEVETLKALKEAGVKVSRSPPSAIRPE